MFVVVKLYLFLYYQGITVKTITVKADHEFDALLNQLTSRLHTTRSNVIRNAVRSYLKQLDKKALRQKILAASLKTRVQAAQISIEFDAANNDSLNDELSNSPNNSLNNESHDDL